MRKAHHHAIHHFHMLWILWVVVIGQTPGHICKQGPWFQYSVDLLVDQDQTLGVASGLICKPSIEGVICYICHVAEVSLRK